MSIINYLSVVSIPIILLIIMSYGFLQKNMIFDDFVEGVKDGLKIVSNIFPTLIGIFLVVGCIRNSGIIDLLIKLLNPITNSLNFPSEIIPLALLRPISGSAAMGIAIDLLNNYGVDSKVGLITSIIMGSTETTFYTIAIYSSSVKIKNIRFVLIPALAADIAAVVTAVVICNV